MQTASAGSKLAADIDTLTLECLSPGSDKRNGVRRLRNKTHLESGLLILDLARSERWRADSEGGLIL